MNEMAFQSKEEQERHQLYAEIERLKAENQRLLDWPDCEECDVPMLKRTLPGQEPVYFCAVCEAEVKLERAQAVIDSYYGCEIEPRMAAFLREFRAALAAAKGEK